MNALFYESTNPSLPEGVAIAQCYMLSIGYCCEAYYIPVGTPGLLASTVRHVLYRLLLSAMMCNTWVRSSPLLPLSPLLALFSSFVLVVDITGQSSTSPQRRLSPDLPKLQLSGVEAPVTPALRSGRNAIRE